MSELFDKRLKFTRSLAGLIEMANSVTGHAVAIRREFDEANESVRHMRGSLHYLGLAADLDLYILQDGKYIYQTSTEAYIHLGEWWKMQSDDHRWGGDFHDSKGNPAPDGCHFSITYGGKS